MSSQCGCSNSESVMTLHSQRILLWKGYPKNRMAHDDRGNQHQNSRILPYRQNRRNRGKENNGKKSGARWTKQPGRHCEIWNAIYTKGDLTVKGEYIRGRTACKASPNYKSWCHWKCISKWRGHSNVEHCPTLPFCQMPVSSGMTILLSPVPRHKGNQW